MRDTRAPSGDAPPFRVEVQHPPQPRAFSSSLPTSSASLHPPQSSTHRLCPRARKLALVASTAPRGRKGGGDEPGAGFEGEEVARRRNDRAASKRNGNTANLDRARLSFAPSPRSRRPFQTRTCLPLGPSTVSTGPTRSLWFFGGRPRPLPLGLCSPPRASSSPPPPPPSSSSDSSWLNRASHASSSSRYETCCGRARSERLEPPPPASALSLAALTVSSAAAGASEGAAGRGIVAITDETFF